MRILFATDGSDDAKAALAYLTQWPLPEGSRVRIVTVSERRPPRADLPALQAFHDALTADRRRLVEQTRGSLSIPAPIEADVLEGTACDEIVRDAQEWWADLVVLGARGLGAFDTALLGSVSLDVARHAPCAVLVVKGGPTRLERVVVGIDGSDESVNAARFAADLPPGARRAVQLVGVVEPIHFPSCAPAVIHPQLRAAIDALKEERRTVLGKAMDQVIPLFEAHGAAVSRVLPEGHPAPTIARMASDTGADLIVVGARGLGGVKRLLLGSVSETVLRAARCPVLIVKRPREA